MTCQARDLDMANSIVRRSIDIIGNYQPRMWLIEIPRTGLLKSQDFIQPYGYVDVDYCQFCDWGYQKPTRVWGPMYFQKLNPELVMGQLVQFFCQVNWANWPSENPWSYTPERSTKGSSG
jgi:hypothetical protein